MIQKLSPIGLCVQTKLHIMVLRYSDKAWKSTYIRTKPKWVQTNIKDAPTASTSKAVTRTKASLQSVGQGASGPFPSAGEVGIPHENTKATDIEAMFSSTSPECGITFRTLGTQATFQGDNRTR
jgi:hypothetical protein